MHYNTLFLKFQYFLTKFSKIVVKFTQNTIYCGLSALFFVHRPQKAGFPPCFRPLAEGSELHVVAIPLSCLGKLRDLQQFDRNYYS